MPATYTLISSNVLTSSQVSVTFSSIPATYTDLVIRFSGRCDNAGVLGTDLRMRFNGDTASNYSYRSLAANGTSATSSGGANLTYGELITYGFESAGNTANTFASYEIYIPSYTAAQSKQTSTFGVSEDNTTAGNDIDAISILYRSNSAISTILFYPTAGNFVSGSSFYLYGISNA